MTKYRNMIKCKFCGDIIESKHRHDFVTCKCGKVSVDGGLDYQRTSFPSDMNPDDCYDQIIEEVKRE